MNIESKEYLDFKQKVIDYTQAQDIHLDENYKPPQKYWGQEYVTEEAKNKAETKFKTLQSELLEIISKDNNFTLELINLLLRDFEEYKKDVKDAIIFSDNYR